MIPLTYENLITCSPLFHINMIAGWEGRNNRCQHVVLNEMPNDGNSLVLLNYSDDITTQIELYLKDDKTTGILILSTQTCDLKSSLTEFANRIKKPILSLNHSSGEVLQKRINEIFYLHEHELLPLLKNDLTTYWIQLFNQHGIDAVIERFNMFLGQEVFFFTNKKRFLPILPSKYTATDFRKMEELENLFLENKQIAIIHTEKAEFFSYEIMYIEGEVLGYLLFEKVRPIEDFPIHLVETIVATIIAWINQTEATRNVHLIYKGQFLFDVLHNNIDTERELIELGQLRGIEFTANALVLTMSLNSHRPITKDIVMQIQDLMVGNDGLEAAIYTTYLNHRIVAVFCPPDENERIAKDNLDQWIGHVQDLIHCKYADIKTIVGIGRSYYSNIDIYKSFQESKIALQMEIYGLGSNGIIHYEDLGFVRLLSYIHNDLLSDFSQQHMGKLEKYDSENESELVHTLSIYCSHNGDIVRTADELFIHQNTLRQRLKKIESILDIELSNYNNLVNLILSLQISKDITTY